MAVLSSDRIKGGEGENNYSNDFIVEHYLTITDTTTDTVVTVLGSALVIQRGTAHPDDSDLICKSVRAVQSEEEPRVWIVTARFERRIPNDTVPDDNPFNRPWLIRYQPVSSTIPCHEDVNGNAIDNSAREQFDPPIEREINDPSITITRNEPFFPLSVAIAYQDAINSDTFYGAAAGTAKIKSISGERKVEGNYVYWEVTYEIHFRRDGWARRILDAGFTKLSGGNQVVITDSAGLPLNAPSLLDGSGGVTSTATFLTFDIYESLAFGLLNLE